MADQRETKAQTKADQKVAKSVKIKAD